MEVYKQKTDLHPTMFGDDFPNWMTCNFTPDGKALCDNPGQWHVIWNTELDNGVACEEHVEKARKFPYLGCHPMKEECFMPGAVYLPTPDICVVDEDGLGLRTEVAVGAHIDGPGGGE